MDMLVSGQAGRIVFIEGNDVSYVEADEPDVKIPTSTAAIPHLLADAHDVVRLEGASEKRAFECLLRNWKADRALRMLQLVLDPDEDLEITSQAAECLTHLLMAEGVLETVENWTYAIPFFCVVDVSEVQKKIPDFLEVIQFVERLARHQEYIARFRSAWNAIRENHFINPVEKKRFELAAINAGAFRKLALAGENSEEANAAVLECYVALDRQPNSRQVIIEWTKNLVTTGAERQLKEVEVDGGRNIIIGDEGFVPAGSTLAVYTVALSAPSDEVVTVDFTTADGTAVAGILGVSGDYEGNSGTLIFQPGETMATIQVTVFGDDVLEAPESFFVNLTVVSGPVDEANSDLTGEGTFEVDEPDDVSSAQKSPAKAQLVGPTTIDNLIRSHLTHVCEVGEILTVLDIGSSMVCSLIARAERKGRLSIIGIGYQASKGITNGLVTDINAAQTSIYDAVREAEQMSGEESDSALVSYTGPRAKSELVLSEGPIIGPEVTSSDIEQILWQAQDAPIGENSDLVQWIPLSYRVDGVRGIDDPNGMYGERLGAEVHLVTDDRSRLRNFDICLSGAGVKSKGLVNAPYAAGLACLTAAEMELGVILINMGAGTTSIAAFIDGNLIYTECVPVGGNHVTNDIARGLSTPIHNAERLKILYGRCLSYSDEPEEMITITGIGPSDTNESSEVHRTLLAGIIQPRLEETFELVRARIDYGIEKRSRFRCRQVVLTGGACQLENTSELAGLILDKKVRIGRPTVVGDKGDMLSSPVFSTSVGLILYAAQKISDRRMRTSDVVKERGRISDRKKAQPLFASLTAGAARALYSVSRGGEERKDDQAEKRTAKRTVRLLSAADRDSSLKKSDSTVLPSRVSDIDQSDSIDTSRIDEDLLDIPAFLRRQAN